MSTKREHDVEDAGDRAQKYRRLGLVRIDLDKLLFWPPNRGGVGVSAYHAHEVAWDCKSNKTKASRYNHIDIVEIPAKDKERILQINKEKCESDPLMPRFSAKSEYVCAGKTHFVHAQKLAKDGGRTLFNDGKTPIKWRDDDTEGPLILESGPLCAIYTSALFDDLEAMNALTADDNMNAETQWGQDEMQAFGRVHLLMDRLAPSQGADHEKWNAEVLAAIEMSGCGTFTSDEWKNFILLRSGLQKPIAEVLKTCQFNACAGRVRVKPRDFGQVAKLDPRAPWAKVAMMLWQYIGSMDKKPTQPNAVTFTGRKEVFATLLKPDTVEELVAEPTFVCAVNTFIMTMLHTYNDPKCGGRKEAANMELLSARGELMSVCGCLLLKVAQALEQVTRKAQLHRVAQSPAARLKVLKEELADKYSKAEDKFRQQLVTLNLYAEADLPAPVHPMKTCGSQPRESTAPSQGSSIKVKEEILPVPSGAASGSGTVPIKTIDEFIIGALTEAHVYNRLGVQGCGEDVMAYVLNSQYANVKDESDGEKTPESQHSTFEDRVIQKFKTMPESAPVDSSDGSWVMVRLSSLNLPQAVIEVQDKVGRFSITVCVDNLRAVSKVKETLVILHPSLREAGEALDDYNFDMCEVSVARAIAEHMLLWAHVSSQSSVERVTISQLSDQSKLPLILQVRANDSFKKGALVLVPAYGEVAHSQGEDDTFSPAPVAKMIHEALLPRVSMQIIAGNVDKRRKAEAKASRITAFEIRSPLLAAKSGNQKNGQEVLENLAPFWAVLRCAGPRAAHNMELETVSLSHGGFDAKGSKFPKLPKGVELSGEIPILRNSSAIEKGEVLCLPFYEGISH